MISIIIPTYNKSELISETLDSLLNQTYENWEALIVDDHSTDNTQEIVAHYLKKDVRFQYHLRPKERPKNANSCRNYGFEISKGDYIIFLDSDDLLIPDCLNSRINSFDTDTDFVVADTGFYKNQKFYPKKTNKDPNLSKSENYLKMFLGYKLPWTIMSPMWKREIVENHRFDENLFRMQDIDFHIRILLDKEWNIKRIHQIDNYYRIEDEKLTSPNHIKDVIASFGYFINKYASLLPKKEIQISHLKRFIFYFYTHYLYPNYKANQKQITVIESAISKLKIFSFKEKIFIKLKKKIIIWNLEESKGFGINRINKFLKRQLNGN